jgi:hypothetical protein
MNLSSRLAEVAEQLPNKEAYWFEGEKVPNFRYFYFFLKIYS